MVRQLCQFTMQVKQKCHLIVIQKKDIWGQTPMCRWGTFMGHLATQNNMPANNEMNTGEMPSVTRNLNVGAENKHYIGVNPTDLMATGESQARGPSIGLNDGSGKQIKPSGADASR